MSVSTLVFGDHSYVVQCTVLYEFKFSLNSYLAGAGLPAELDSLADLIEFNNTNTDEVMPWFGQELFEMAQQKGGLEEAAYKQALQQSNAAMRTKLDDLFAAHQIDVLVVPSNSPAWKTDWVKGDHFAGVYSSAYAAVSGYPSVTVPAGFYAGLPLGLSFVGQALQGARVIQVAYVFEQHTQARRAPTFLPTIETP